MVDWESYTNLYILNCAPTDFLNSGIIIAFKNNTFASSFKRRFNTEEKEYDFENTIYYKPNFRR